MLKHYQKSIVKSPSTIFGGSIDSEEIVSGGGYNLILTCYISCVGKSFTVRESFISQLLENGEHI